MHSNIIEEEILIEAWRSESVIVLHLYDGDQGADHRWKRASVSVQCVSGSGFCCWSGCADDAYGCSCGAWSGESGAFLMASHRGWSVRLACHLGMEACMALALLMLLPWQRLAG